MSISPEVIHPQNVTEFTQRWKAMPLDRKDSGKGSSCARLTSGDVSSSGEDGNAKVRKPYTITKQRERWTESEHQKFLEALKLYGRTWRRIEEYIGTKTAVQIRSHAQKFFSKLEREASTGSSVGKVPEIEIPPPRPKRKPSHPYPKKAGSGIPTPEDDSKEAMTGQIPVSLEGTQSVSCSPRLSKGLGSGSVPLCRGSLVPGHFFGSKGSMKLFGKTVVVPKNHKAALPNGRSNEIFLNGEFASPGTQASKPEFKQSGGFSPFVKLRNNEVLSEERSCLDNNGELNANDCGGMSAVMNETGAAQPNLLNEGEEQQYGDKVDMKAIAHTFGLPPHGVVDSDMQLPHGSHHSNPIQQWMDSLVCHHNGLSMPPMAGHGLPEALPLAYWQILQASAANYAAYTAAMAAAAATGWTGSFAGCEVSSRTAGNDALYRAASSWWPFRGFMPLGYNSHPMGSVNQGMQPEAAADIHPLEDGNEGAALEHSSSQGGQHPVESEIVDETRMSKPCSMFDPEVGEKRHRDGSPSAKNGCDLGTSCITEAPSFKSIPPDSAGQHGLDAEVMKPECCSQESDPERRVSFESLQSLYSSSEEFEGQVKKQGEGSSSGSNTPASGSGSGECEADLPTSLESKKRVCFVLFEDNTDACSDAFIKPHQLCGVNAMESPNMRAKHAEKGRKHQLKDSRHGRGDGDDSKRLRSCAHELEARKEVSQEGRKAFQALFNSKLLPQTFPATSMVDGILSSFKQESVSKPSVSKAESHSINVPDAQLPVQGACGDSTSHDGSPWGQDSGKFSNTAGAMVELTVSSGSGFVPYRRPLCTKPNMSESSAL